jgi:hypothetical protein
LPFVLFFWGWISTPRWWGLCLLDRPSHHGGLWPLHRQPVCSMWRWRGRYNRHVCVSLCNSLWGFFNPDAELQRGTIDWSARKPWRQMEKERGEEATSCGGWVMIGRVKWGGRRAGRSGLLPRCSPACKVLFISYSWGQKLFVSEWFVCILLMLLLRGACFAVMGRHMDMPLASVVLLWREIFVHL